VFSPTYGGLYAYAANNPVRYIDPDGEEVFWGPFTGTSIKWAGNKIHRKVQDELKNTYGGEIEVKISGAGRADYVVGNEIYEVKPYTQVNMQAGKEQLQNYVDHSKPGTEKGVSLLERIPKEIKIKDFVLLETNNLRITCDICCKTNPRPEQAGMVYYIPYNWRVENKSGLSTEALIKIFVFGSMFVSGVSSIGQITTYIVEDSAAACFVLMPAPVLNYYTNKENMQNQIMAN